MPGLTNLGENEGARGQVPFRLRLYGKSRGQLRIFALSSPVIAIRMSVGIAADSTNSLK